MANALQIMRKMREAKKVQEAAKADAAVEAVKQQATGEN
jgi:hypothetical protein